MTAIAPVLVLSTGRCGSTMISYVLNRHPRILSLSEFFVSLGAAGFARATLSGEAMWKIYSRPSPALPRLLKEHGPPDEIIYPFGAKGARFSPHNVPPILHTTLPHLTASCDALYDELEAVVRARPKAPLAAHYRFLFEWLCARLKRDVWIERSGGSLMIGAKLLRLFPEARVVHVFRDGRDTALSMQRHHPFRVLLAALVKARKLGIDGFKDFSSPALKRFRPLQEELFFRFADVRAREIRALDLADFGDLWSRMILAARTCLSPLAPDRLLELRFEDVQRRPREELRKLVDFIDPGLADDQWLEWAATIPRPGAPKYPDLEPEQRARLTRACAPGLAALGYSFP